MCLVDRESSQSLVLVVTTVLAVLETTAMDHHRLDWASTLLPVPLRARRKDKRRAAKAASFCGVLLMSLSASFLQWIPILLTISRARISGSSTCAKQQNGMNDKKRKL